MAKLVVGTNSKNAVPSSVVYKDRPGSIPRIVNEDGDVLQPNKPIDLLGVKNVGVRAYWYAMYGNERLYGDGVINSDDVVQVYGTNAFRECFDKCSNVNRVLFNNLESASGNSCFENAFAETGIKMQIFPKLKRVYGTTAFYRAYMKCSQLKMIAFPSLEDIGSNSFNQIVQGVDGCWLRFPAAMQSTLQNVNFSGDNTVVRFVDMKMLKIRKGTGIESLYWYGIDITNEDEFPFDIGVENPNLITVATDDGRLAVIQYTPQESDTEFVVDLSDITFRTVDITSNMPWDSISVVADNGYSTVTLTPDENNRVYVSDGTTITVNAQKEGYVLPPQRLTVWGDSTITLNFVQPITVTYTPSQFIANAIFTTDAGQYYSYDANDETLLVHTTSTAAQHFSAGLEITIPENVSGMIIETEAYVSSEANYDFGFLSISSMQQDLTYTQIKNSTIVGEGQFLFRQSGLNTEYVPILETVSPDSYVPMILTVGWGQDTQTRGTNTMYVKSIKISFIPNA